MKKKLIIALVMVLAIVSLSACSGMTTVESIKSEIFTDEAYQDAVTECQTFLSDWEGITVKKISYAGDDAVYADAEVRGEKPENLIILLVTFETDDEDHQNGLEPGTVYENYTFTFTRSDFTMPWEHKDHGYG